MGIGSQRARVLSGRGYVPESLDRPVGEAAERVQKSALAVVGEGGRIENTSGFDGTKKGWSNFCLQSGRTPQQYLPIRNSESSSTLTPLIQGQ